MSQAHRVTITTATEYGRQIFDAIRGVHGDEIGGLSMTINGGETVIELVTEAPAKIAAMGMIRMVGARVNVSQVP